jgi:hypothetical protein
VNVVADCNNIILLDLRRTSFYNKHAEDLIILGSSKGWLPYYYMGSRAMIAGMNN